MAASGQGPYLATTIPNTPEPVNGGPQPKSMLLLVLTTYAAPVEPPRTENVPTGAAARHTIVPVASNFAMTGLDVNVPLPKSAVPANEARKTISAVPVGSKSTDCRSNDAVPKRLLQTAVPLVSSLARPKSWTPVATMAPLPRFAVPLKLKARYIFPVESNAWAHFGVIPAATGAAYVFVQAA